MELGLSQCRSETLTPLKQHPTIQERLIGQKQEIQERLDEIEKALSLLEKYPEMEKLFTALSRLV